MTATSTQMAEAAPAPGERREQKRVALRRRVKLSRGFLSGLLDSCIHTDEDSTAWLGEKGCEKRTRSTVFKTRSRRSSCCHRPGDWSNRTMIRSSCSRFWCETTHGIDAAARGRAPTRCGR